MIYYLALIICYPIAFRCLALGDRNPNSCPQVRESHCPRLDSVAGVPEISVPSYASRGELGGTLLQYGVRASVVAPLCAPEAGPSLLW